MRVPAAPSPIPALGRVFINPNRYINVIYLNRNKILAGREAAGAPVGLAGGWRLQARLRFIPHVCVGGVRAMGGVRSRLRPPASPLALPAQAAEAPLPHTASGRVIPLLLRALRIHTFKGEKGKKIINFLAL